MSAVGGFEALLVGQQKEREATVPNEERFDTEYRLSSASQSSIRC